MRTVDRGLPWSVLLVESDVEQAVLTRRAFKLAEMQVSIVVEESAADAIRFLSSDQAGPGAARGPMLELVLIDWKLANSGAATLTRWIRKQPSMRWLPVVAVFPSIDETWAPEAAAAGTDLYLTRPVTPASLTDLVMRLKLPFYA